MNNNPILDDLRDTPIKERSVRPLAIILELIPYLILLFSLGFGSFGGALLFIFPVWYLLTSWYLFKGSTYKRLDIIIAECAGLLPLIVSLGFLFKLQSWEGGNELFVFAMITGFLIAFYLLFRFINKKDDPLEYRFSLKLFSRVIVLSGLLAFVLVYIMQL